MELDFVAFVDIPEMLGRGDCSTAWNVANLASHHRTLALFSEQAQHEVWAESPDALIASGIAYAQGRARTVDGGIVLSGFWNFCSGVNLSTWNILACTVRDGDKIVDYRQCLLRRSEYEVIDDWQTLGMRGTGSRSVKCEELFVPEYRTLSMHSAAEGHAYPGLRAHANPMFRVPTSALGGHSLAAAIIGNAQAALDTMIELVKSRSTSYTGARMRDFQTVQLRIGSAGARIDAARLMVRNDCLQAGAAVKSGETLDMASRLRCKRNAAAAVKLAAEAVDALHEMAGANGIYDSFPLQRIFRDARSASAHIHFNVDVQLTQWALVALGGEFKSPTL
jgi:3-hydroxy-9,10-secoandrosta-1,3,5(10)-triene-9,17-dione monooxygenase